MTSAQRTYEAALANIHAILYAGNLSRNEVRLRSVQHLIRMLCELPRKDHFCVYALGLTSPTSMSRVSGNLCLAGKRQYCTRKIASICDCLLQFKYRITYWIGISLPRI